MTTIMQDLGAGPRLVGRTPWCRGVDDLPVVGALDGVDAEVLVALQPAVVVHQPPSAGPDPVLVSLQERLGFTLVGGRLDGSDDVIAAIDALTAAGVGDAALAAQHRAAMDAMRRSAVSESPEDAAGVLILFSVDPFSAAGRQTYLDEIVRAAGARNVTARTGWIELSVEEIAGLSPDVVLLVSGSPAAADTLAGIPWRSAPEVVRLDAPEALEPSTRMPSIVSRVQALLAEPGA
jgi:ABC-type hemin transport system substrate-binding protein